MSTIIIKMFAVTIFIMNAFIYVYYYFFDVALMGSIY